MYSEGGALRLCDGTFSNDNSALVMQYFETGLICGITDNIMVGHEIMNQDLEWQSGYTINNGSSTTGLIRSANHDDNDDLQGSGTDWLSTSRLSANRWKFSFEVYGDQDTGNWNGKHLFYASAVYLDGSESLPSHSFTNTNTTPAANFTDSTANAEWDFLVNRQLRIRMLCHPNLIVMERGYLINVL